MSKTVKCPKWGCDGVGIPVDTKKKFSFGKALVGNTVGGLFGPVGAVLSLRIVVRAASTSLRMQSTTSSWGKTSIGIDRESVVSTSSTAGRARRALSWSSVGIVCNLFCV